MLSDIIYQTILHIIRSKAGKIFYIFANISITGASTPGPNYRPNSGFWGRGPQKSFGLKKQTPLPKGPGQSINFAFEKV